MLKSRKRELSVSSPQIFPYPNYSIPLPPATPLLFMMPGGAAVTVAQAGKSRVVLLEANGLQHGGFDLPHLAGNDDARKVSNLSAESAYLRNYVLEGRLHCDA